MARTAAVLILLLCSMYPGGPALPQDTDIAARWDIRDVMIPMRDGVKLHTVIYLPRNRKEALPILLTRTPCGVGGAARNFGGSYKELADDATSSLFRILAAVTLPKAPSSCSGRRGIARIRARSMRPLTPATRSTGS
jgi:hypothetical protein